MKRLKKRIQNWEQWPFAVLYAPIFPVWLWYILRSGAVWFFTPSNPKLTFGGMEGEPKKEMQELLPAGLYPTSFNVLPAQEFAFLIQQLAEKNIRFPLIVKPEIGGQGILVRKLDTEEQLKNYHQKSPVEYIIQEMVKYPMEVSAFYYRFPHLQKGNVSGFLHKIPLQVKGDGVKTLQQLIMQHPKAAKRKDELYFEHAKNFFVVIPAGEKYILSYAANHNRGAHFIDLKDEIDERLINIFDSISHSINDFFYGRYDVMCTSVEDLKQRKNFVILEYNGAGAEPNHFYDTGYTLLGAYKEILKHWKALYHISRYNYKQGIKYWPLLKGLKFLRQTKKHYKIIKEADKLI